MCVFGELVPLSSLSLPSQATQEGLCQPELYFAWEKRKARIPRSLSMARSSLQSHRTGRESPARHPRCSLLSARSPPPVHLEAEFWFRARAFARDQRPSSPAPGRDKEKHCLGPPGAGLTDGAVRTLPPTSAPDRERGVPNTSTAPVARPKARSLSLCSSLFTLSWTLRSRW